MGNSTNKITEAVDAAEDLSTFLARVAYDGTLSDVLTSVKSDQGTVKIDHIQKGRFSAAQLNLLEDLVVDYVTRVGALSTIDRVADTVQELKALGTNDGVSVGDLARISTTGNVWRCATAAATTSTWVPGPSIFFAEDYGVIGGVVCGAEFQNAIDDVANSGGGRLILPIAPHGVAPISVDVALEVPFGVEIVGQGRRNQTSIVGTSAIYGDGIFRLGGDRISLSDMRIGWGDVSASVSAGSDAIRIIGACGLLELARLHIFGVDRGIATGTQQASEVINFFSSNLHDLWIAGFRSKGIYNQPASSGDSGSVLSNIHINNSGQTQLRPVSAFDWREAQNCVINQMNIEVVHSTTHALMYLQGCDSIVVNGLHLEANTHEAASNNVPLIHIVTNTNAIFQGLKVMSQTTIGASRRFAIFGVNDNTQTPHPTLDVRGLSQSDSTIGSSEFNIVYGRAGLSYASGWRCRIGPYASDYAYNRVLDLDAAEYLGVLEYDGIPAAAALTGAYRSIANPATAFTADWGVGGPNQQVDFHDTTGNVTAAFSNPVQGLTYHLRLRQGATARTITWPAAVLWAGGAPPTLSTGNDEVDLFRFYFDGTNYFGEIVGQAYA